MHKEIKIIKQIFKKVRTKKYIIKYLFYKFKRVIKKLKK